MPSSSRSARMAAECSTAPICPTSGCRIPTGSWACSWKVQLRKDWKLYLEGDSANLPRILDQVNRIDVFHYDSDKMRSGREFAVSLIKERLSPDGVIVMDDIFNDDWFRNYVTTHDLPFAVVERRYGIIGSLVATSRQTLA